jgi:phosphatidylinositol glycan class W
VHWNFFFTLGLLPPVLALIVSIKSKRAPFWTISLVIGVLYELLLASNTGLKAWTLTSPRENIFSQNKEGIVSFAGTNIHLERRCADRRVSINLPWWTRSCHPAIYREEICFENGPCLNRLEICTMDGVNDCIGEILESDNIAALGEKGYKVSVTDKQANLPYICWVCSYNAAFLFGNAMVQKLLFPNTTDPDDLSSPMLQAINFNGLAIFLLVRTL